MVISTPSLKELPVVSTMDTATQRYEELRHIVTQYLDGNTGSELISDVKRALYELQDYHQTQLSLVNDLIAEVHTDQTNYVYPTNETREDDDDEYWYYNDKGDIEFEHSSEGC